MFHLKLISFLDEIDDTEVFLGLSYAIRIFEALGYAPMNTAAFATIAAEFEADSVATIFVKLLHILLKRIKTQ